MPSSGSSPEAFRESDMGEGDSDRIETKGDKQASSYHLRDGFSMIDGMTGRHQYYEP